MFRGMLLEATMTIYRGGGKPRYFDDKKGFWGTWGAGIYFSKYRDEAERYGDVQEYKFKGQLVDAEDDRPLPDEPYQKILSDLKLTYSDIDNTFTSDRFWSQVQGIIIAGRKKRLTNEKMFKAIKKHSGVSGFLGAGHEVILFLASDAKKV